MTPKPKLLVATTNTGKLAELTGLFAGVPVKLLSLREIGKFDEIEETGHTFAENARLKACGYASQARLLTLADDSGLEVEALDNRPGALSARYGGPDTSFVDKMSILLEELEKTRDAERVARFVCLVAVADAEGRTVYCAEGVCEGSIAREPRGNMGFGYDPIFIPNGYHETFGELSDAVKQKISHRAVAFDQIIPFLRDYIAI